MAFDKDSKKYKLPPGCRRFAICLQKISVMGHHHHEESAEKNISIVFFLNLFFVVIEVAGGIITNSIAILSDAVHDIGDCLSLAVSWGLQKKSSKSRDGHYSYGYKRYSLLGSLFLSGVLSVSSVWVLVKACGRLFNPEAVDAGGMLWLAVLGIVVNGAAAFRVKGGHSMNERSVYLHIMEDVLGWAAVLIASVVMVFWDIPILDPIMSILISLWVLYHVYENTRDVVRVLLQAIPEGVSLDELVEEIQALPGVESIHDLHVWSLDGESHVMTLHLVCDESSDRQAIRTAINEVSGKHGISQTTVEFEEEGFDCGFSTGC